MVSIDEHSSTDVSTRKSHHAEQNSLQILWIRSDFIKYNENALFNYCVKYSKVFTADINTTVFIVVVQTVICTHLPASRHNMSRTYFLWSNTPTTEPPWCSFRPVRVLKPYSYLLPRPVHLPRGRDHVSRANWNTNFVKDKTIRFLRLQTYVYARHEENKPFEGFKYFQSTP